MLFLILLLLIILICCFSYSRCENFTEITCDVIQNEPIVYEQAMHYMYYCNNIGVGHKRKSDGSYILYAEQGDQYGPLFSKDFLTWYYQGEKQWGLNEFGDNLNNEFDYDYYYYPWYNPIRYIYGSKPFYRRRPFAYRIPNWNRRNLNYPFRKQRNKNRNKRNENRNKRNENKRNNDKRNENKNENKRNENKINKNQGNKKSQGNSARID